MKDMLVSTDIIILVDSIGTYKTNVYVQIICRELFFLSTALLNPDLRSKLIDWFLYEGNTGI